jgi:hypothetical protein
MRRTIPVLVAATLAALLAGCAAEKPPVAELTVSPPQIDLGWPEFAEIEIAIEPLAELPTGEGPPIVFLHLLDEPGSVVRTFDHPLPQPWRIGRPIVYRVRLHQSALGEPLEAGLYLLSVGLYRPELGRFPLATGGEPVSRFEYRVATVAVAAPGEGMPHPRFSDNWLPPEPGADRQVVARRALRGGSPGTLKFGPVKGAGRLFVGLVIPGDPGPSARLDILDGGSLPKVRIQSSCGGGQLEVSGLGRIDVDLDVPSADGERECEISIAPNFQITSSERAEATSVVLETLSWGPAADGSGS